MPIESTLKVVNSLGATVWQADSDGVKDGSNRIHHPAEFLIDRIFATPLAAYLWTCQEGVWQISHVSAMCSVTGGASTTCDVLVCTSAQAPGSGATQLTGAMDIEATAPFLVQGVLIASPTLIYPGMSVARVFAGTVASVEGKLTVQIKRVS